MSIYIRGIEMPKDGAIGVVIYSDGRVTSQFGAPAPGRAVPVPPHGRLGDLDALKRELVLDYAYAAADMVDNAPTIIPASKDGE